MESIFSLGIMLSVIDKISAPLRMIGGGLATLKAHAQKLGPTFDKFESYGQKVAIAGGLMLTVLAGTAGAFSTLEAAQLRLTTNIMDSSGRIGPEFQKLNSLAGNLGTSLPGSTRDMLDMFTALREQGVQTTVILGGMGEAAAKFSVLVGVPYVQGATYVAKFAEAFGIADNQTVQFMDTLQRLKGAAGIDVPSLAESIKYVGSSLKTMGVQGIQAGRDVSSALGLMAVSSIEGSQAGTGLAMAMSRMAEISSRLDSGKIAKLVGPILDAQGIKLNFFDGNGQFVGIRNMIGEMEKLRAINPQEQMIVLSKLFGEEAARPLAVFVNQGVAGFDAMTLKMAQQADMQQKIGVIMGGIGMKWDTVTGTVQNFIMHIGAVVSETAHLGAALDWVNSAVSRIDGFISSYPKLATAMTGVVVVAAALAFVLGGVATVIGIIGLGLPGFAAGWTAAGTALVWLKGAVLQMLPALGSFAAASWAAFVPWFLAGGWIVVAVMAIIAALGYLYYKFEGVRNAVNIVLYVLGYFLGALVKVGKGIWTSLQPALAALMPLLQRLAPIALAVGAAIKWAFLNLTPLGWMIQGFLAVEQYFARLDWHQSGAKIVATLISGIKSGAGALVDTVSGVFASVRNLLPFSDAKEGPLSSLTLSGARIMETLGAGVVGAAPGLQRTISTALAGAALATTVAVSPVASGPQAPQASPRAQTSASREGRSIVIQSLTVTLPGVSNAEDFVSQLQALVEGYDV